VESIQLCPPAEEGAAAAAANTTGHREVRVKIPCRTELTGIPNIYTGSEVTSCLEFYYEFFIFKK